MSQDNLLVWGEKLRTSLWPVPLLMLLLAGVLFALGSWADSRLSNPEALRTWWLHSGSGDDARNLLSTLVSAIITMSSVVLSITIVTLTLAANQFGSRLVRVYMTDVWTKLSLGLFVMTIVYCLLVLRSVQQDMPADQVPHLSVTFGLALGIACVLVMLLFLHNVARSIVADVVVARVARELEETIESLPLLGPPEREVATNRQLHADPEHAASIVSSEQEGYVQAIRYEELAAAAQQQDVVVRLSFRAGDFMCRGGWLAEVTSPARSELSPELVEAIRRASLIGPTRTPTQDLEFSLRHLVDVALRALSPGINDPNTALVVVDRLRGALSRLMLRELPAGLYRDNAGAVRVVGKHHQHGDLLDAAFHQIRQAAEHQPSVVIGMIRAIGRIAEHARRREQCQALLRHANLIASTGLRGTEERDDRQDIQQTLAAVERKIRALRL